MDHKLEELNHNSWDSNLQQTDWYSCGIFFYSKLQYIELSKYVYNIYDNYEV